MGGTESKTTISALSEQISTIASETVQNCVVNTSQDQLINVNNTGWKWSSNINVEQQTEVSSTCFSDLNKQTDLQNRIQNAIEQASTASGVALLSAFGKDSASASTELRSLIRSNVTMSNIQSNYNTIRQTQQVTYSNSGIVVFDTVNVTQGAKVFAAATLQQIDRSGIFNTIQSHIEQTTEATSTNPLDFIAKAIGAIGNVFSQPIMLFILLICLVIVGGIALAYFVFSGPSSTTTATPTSGSVSTSS